MKSKLAHLAVFSGTGNTLAVALALADELRLLGLEVRMFPMERREIFSLPPDAALGIVTTVACFSTYPTAWRFIDALPPGEGREAFFLATMGGVSCGMQGPVRRAVERKGYRPTGSLIVTMPSNYGNKTINEAGNKTLEKKAANDVKKFARDLAEGSASWHGGVPLLSKFFASLAHGGRPWKMFYRIFPLEADGEKCTGCGLCAELCPEGNISISGGFASIGKNCESCQRCAAVCPALAVRVPNKPAERYRGAAAGDLRALRDGRL